MIRKIRNRCLSFLLAAGVLLLGITLPANAAGTPTNLGMAAHGIAAYRDGWVYVYGGKGETGADGVRQSDCAGLVYAYFSDLGALGNCKGGVTSQVNYNCVYSGSLSQGIPRIHGLVLTMPDRADPAYYQHIGIYIGNNEVVDNSDYGINMLRGPAVGSSRDWTAWHLFDNGMKYAANGWYALDGQLVHYTQYEYDVDTVIDGIAIGSDGYALNADVSSVTLSQEYASASQVAAYLKNEYTPEEPSPDPSLYNGKVTGTGVRLRQEATTKSPVLATLAKGSSVQILGEESGEKVASTDIWYKVTTTQGKTGYLYSQYVQREGSSPQALQAPIISASGGYVTLTTAAAGADIYYTHDGSAPTEESTPYTGPVYLTGCTYKAIAVKDGRVSPVSSAVVLSNNAVFTDFTAEDWYFRNVDRAVEAGIFNGYGNGVFAPTQTITRAQFVMALSNLDQAELSLYSEDSGFSDIQGQGLNSSMRKAITWATANQLIRGFGDNTFHPNEPVTREQMCVILAEYAGLERTDASSPAFSDDAALSSWARDAVYACRDSGLISGMGGNLFNPRSSATRAQACVIFVNLYDR